jgi:hypothetical protein
VAWVYDEPIFEHVEFNPNLLPLLSGAQMLEYRAKSHNTLEWRDLPHDRLTRVELYFARERFPDQPAWRADRELGLDMRFIQMKMGSIVIDSTGMDGQKRTGIIGYRMGFWIPSRKECQMWEFTRNGYEYMGNVKDPCAPRPEGFGFAPHVIGK